ncbi:hypothetical protein HYW94_04390 [Candidatus Uhrbacteria bacterium]|nr:hypothetical protein [Candidatus Uhrbacteria bacterium]
MRHIFSSLFLASFTWIFFATPVHAQEEIPYVYFTTTPNTVIFGKPVVLEWTSEYVVSCTASGTWSGDLPLSGLRTMYPKKSQQKYGIQCSDAAGRKTIVVSRTVLGKKKVTKKNIIPSVSFSANTATVSEGDSVTLSWNARNATACNAKGPDRWTGLKRASGQQTVFPMESGSYMLVCWNANGISTPVKMLDIFVDQKEEQEGSIPDEEFDQPQIPKQKDLLSEPPQEKKQVQVPIIEQQKQPIPAQPTQPESKQPEKVVVAPVAVVPLPIPDCDGTAETLKKIGVITCGRITWKLHPTHAALLAGDPRGYLMFYDRLYGTLKDLLAYEPKEKKMEIMEQCPLKGGASCPNGKMGWDYPMYVLGGNTVYITSDFFENYFWKLANSTDHSISASIQHEMGHIFTPSQDTKYAYLWDDSFIEKFASVWGNMGALMANELNNTGEKYYWDAWCRAKGKSASTCIDPYATLDDWASLGSDADWKNFIANPKAVGNVYPYTLDMLVQLYRQFKNQGKLSEFYNGFRATFRYYDTEFPLPLAWKTPDIKNQSRDIVSAKAAFFAFLLSYFTETDLLPTFETWGYPISQETKDAYALIRKSGYDYVVFLVAVENLTNPQTVYTGTGNGLTGSYYDSIDSYHDVDSSSLKLTRVDPAINFDWQLSAPDARMGYDTFFVKWTGYIEAPLTGTYTFSTIGDDGVLLLVNGQPIINDWNVHAPKENSGTITLEAGWKYAIRLEYFDEFYGAEIHLFWTLPGKKKELIPQSQLYAQ